MVFSSYLFLFYFLPVALALYYLVPRRWRQGLLTGVSYGFYGWANPLFMVLMAVSTLIDYLCGLVLACNGWPGAKPMVHLDPDGPRSRCQRVTLAISLASNLLILGFFKYFNFGVGNVNAIAQALGMPGLETTLRITLPLGISFYTFQSMSYAIDVYRGHAKALPNIVDFACFVSMFPQLVAGPIIRFSEVAEQMRTRTHTVEKFARGVAFFSLGLAKKILVANPCGKMADTAFDAAALGSLDAWCGLLAYAFQIYFDFSTYSDMAIGLGLMLGFVFPKNFNSPYRAESITDFWRRWHISLSSWLRDYLYIPLGGNRKGSMRTYINLMLVMLLGGLWHGASWNFVAWGGIHGIGLCLERLAGKKGFYHRWPRPLKVAITFGVVLIAWVFFRAPDMPAALAFLGHLAGLGPVPGTAGLLAGILYQPYYLGTLALAAILVWAAPQTWDWTRVLTGPKAVAVVGLLALAVAVLLTQAYNPFIYFIF